MMAHYYEYSETYERLSIYERAVARQTAHVLL